MIVAGAQAMLMVAAGIVLAGGMWGKAWLVSWVVGVYLMALGGGMIVLGLPERRYPDRFAGYRWFVLVCGGMSELLGMGMGALAAMGRAMLPVFSIEMVSLVGAAATLLYIRKLAHRMGSHKLAKVLGWLLLIPLLKFVQAFPLWGFYMGWYFLGVGEILPWLYVPVSMGVLIYLGIGFRRAAREAEVNWAKAG
jgi:hypothetical protein